MLSVTIIHPVLASATSSLGEHADRDGVMLLLFMAALITFLSLNEKHGARSYLLALAICSALLAIIAFAFGSWLMAIVEVFWSLAVFQKWRAAKRAETPTTRLPPTTNPVPASVRAGSHDPRGETGLRTSRNELRTSELKMTL